ncbi:UPF0172-domain-containing protein [Tilletiaria anomala UBC 951]|uniref:UPF0172-domain-containing protein n=1 Tax=Tilletiaria anomala (strain ATCC 24038 / CBS 436.72 / UBC 951) TaxID=1037660 RepID=A0A066VCG5_TILAU|nr:UPF0172-domain-containing protein [Tilletiaria anomala UBC 951]KDN39166.1 UPF0172-domain-containing protein [Tilletiaria anomala UBC 951]
MAQPQSSPQSYILTPKAYTKITLHAAKYPASALLGLLLGRQTPTSNAAIVVEDIVPLVHKWTTLSPVVEVGCALAESHASTSGLSLIGCYEAPARVVAVNDRELSPAATRLAQRIANRSHSGTALVCLVNNALLLSPTSSPFIPFIQLSFPTTSSSSIAQSSTNIPKPRLLTGSRALTIGDPAGSSNAAAPGTGTGTEKELAEIVRGAAKAVRAGAWSALADFDDHLGDPALDWLNNAQAQDIVT